MSTYTVAVTRAAPDFQTAQSSQQQEQDFEIAEQKEQDFEIARQMLQTDISNEITDTRLRAEVEKALGKTSGATITADEMATLTTLSLRNEGIASITGLEHAVGLTSLELPQNELTSVAVPSLPLLSTLDLSVNDLTSVTGLTAANLPQLETLNLSQNDLTSVTVGSLPQLRTLDISINPHTSFTIPLLPELTTLQLIGHPNGSEGISTLSGLTLANLPKIQHLPTQLQRHHHPRGAQLRLPHYLEPQPQRPQLPHLPAHTQQPQKRLGQELLPQQPQRREANRTRPYLRVPHYLGLQPQVQRCHSQQPLLITTGACHPQPPRTPADNKPTRPDWPAVCRRFAAAGSVLPRS